MSINYYLYIRWCIMYKYLFYHGTILYILVESISSCIEYMLHIHILYIRIQTYQSVSHYTEIYVCVLPFSLYYNNNMTIHWTLYILTRHILWLNSITWCIGGIENNMLHYIHIIFVDIKRVISNVLSHRVLMQYIDILRALSI